MSHPYATTSQRNRIAELADGLGYEELLDAHERAAVACNYVETLTDRDGHEYAFADMNAWGAAGVRGYTSREAAALIREFEAIAAEGDFAPCYCGQRGEKRGEPCRTVLYYRDGYDGVYDYECGLS